MTHLPAYANVIAIFEEAAAVGNHWFSGFESGYDLNAVGCDGACNNHAAPRLIAGKRENEDLPVAVEDRARWDSESFPLAEIDYAAQEHAGFDTAVGRYINADRSQPA